VSVTREQVREIAALARLRLTEAEAEKFAVQLSEILDHVAELSGAVPEETVDAGTEEDVSPLRDDEPGADPLAFPPLELAPDWRGGFFTVPRLAEMDGDPDGPEAAK